MVSPSTEAQPENAKELSVVMKVLVILIPVMILSALYVAIYSFALTEPMKASRLSWGVMSRTDFPGFAILCVAMVHPFLVRGKTGAIIPVIPLLLGCGLIYWSYFGAMDAAVLMGEHHFTEALVAETGCVPPEWIPIAANRGFASPEPDVICQ